MPAWIHDRAEHILAKNPSMPKSQAFAIATQQSHALGKSPKGYGTSAGRTTAKKKYDTPKDDKKTANPGGLKSSKMEKKAMTFEGVQYAAFVDELAKIAACMKEKDSGAFDAFLGGAGKAVSGISSAPRAAQAIQKALPRAAHFTPAVVGHPASLAKKLPLPTGALNPGGGFH